MLARLFAFTVKLRWLLAFSVDFDLHEVLLCCVCVRVCVFGLLSLFCLVEEWKGVKDMCACL